MQRRILKILHSLGAMGLHRPFQNAGWVWVKLLLGLPMFEGTLVTIDATAQRAAALSARVAAGEVDPGQMADLVGREWNSLWVIMALAVAQTVIGVWRPKRRRPRGA